MDEVERRMCHGCRLTACLGSKLGGLIGNIAGGFVGIECCLTNLGFAGVALHPCVYCFERQPWSAIVWLDSFEDRQHLECLDMGLLGCYQVVGVGE